MTKEFVLTNLLQQDEHFIFYFKRQLLMYLLDYLRNRLTPAGTYIPQNLTSSPPPHASISKWMSVYANILALNKLGKRAKLGECYWEIGVSASYFIDENKSIFAPDFLIIASTELVTIVPFHSYWRQTMLDSAHNVLLAAGCSEMNWL